MKMLSLLFRIMRFMKEIIKYCYYRIAKAYKALDPMNYCDWGFWILSGSLGFIALSITTVILHVYSVALNDKIILAVFIPVFVVDAFFSICISDKTKQDRFGQLDERYKNERLRHLKGWLVFLYLIGTVILYIGVL